MLNKCWYSSLPFRSLVTMHHQQKQDLVPMEESELVEKQLGFVHVKVETCEELQREMPNSGNEGANSE